MYELVVQNVLIVTYRTCIHRTVDVPYGLGFEQAYAEITSQNQIVTFHVRRKAMELEDRVASEMELSRIVAKHIGLELKEGFETGCCSFCLGFGRKPTDLNSISPSFWKIDCLDPST